MMKKTMKKPVKKADGGMMSRPGVAVGSPVSLRTPPTGGPMMPVRPAMATMPRAMPMRKAKGGMADGGKWIQGAIKHPGALRSALGAKKGEPIPMKKLEKAAHSKNPKMAKRANLAMTLRGMKKK